MVSRIRSLRSLVVIVAALIAPALIFGCRNTANGVAADSRKVVHKTGKGLSKAGKGVEKAGNKVQKAGNQ
jgi:predicted small secreted protein